MPVVGYLSQTGLTDSASIVAAFRQGLKEVGYVEGQMSSSNFAMRKGRLIACRPWRVVRGAVNVFAATGGTGSVVKAKPMVPKTIPIVFAMGGDPVKSGIVAGTTG
jgi:putative ABC transport system substrate-binding protein